MMAHAISPDQYVFDHTIIEQRDDYLTNQLIAFNQTPSTTLLK